MSPVRSKFFKYQAMGNDMLVIDPAVFGFSMSPQNIRMLCRRNFGIGADGICFGPLNLPGSTIYEMRFFNPDGSESEKSGNGLRVFARYLWDSGYIDQRSFKISIHQEVIGVQILDQQAQRLAIEMGKISFQSDAIQIAGIMGEVVSKTITIGAEELIITAVSVGNPHCIVFTADLSQIYRLGPILETAPQFLNRTNVQTVNIIDHHTIEIAIWERGAGHTLASGSSATATAAAAVRQGFCQSPVTVIMEGGTSQVIIDNNWMATLIGEVVAVYEGELAQDFLQNFLV